MKNYWTVELRQYLKEKSELYNVIMIFELYNDIEFYKAISLNFGFPYINEFI
jgi:hypothetical protein